VRGRSDGTPRQIRRSEAGRGGRRLAPPAHILLLRSAPTGKQLDTSSALTADEIERELERYASALRAYAPDILWGDFELFPQLASLVKRRKRELDDSYE
jgi:hypothetical protein